MNEEQQPLDLDMLEEVMRPKDPLKMSDYESVSGFLGQSEKLADVLAADAEIVNKSGLTHEQIARPLKEAAQIALDHLKKSAFRETTEKFFILHFSGNNYEVHYEASPGRQYSPFQDDTHTNMDITLVRQSDRKTLTFSGLLPEMISRYGFYEGKQVPYRLDPEVIIEFFHLAPDLNQHNRDTQG